MQRITIKKSLVEKRSTIHIIQHNKRDFSCVTHNIVHTMNKEILLYMLPNYYNNIDLAGSSYTC